MLARRGEDSTLKTYFTTGLLVEVFLAMVSSYYVCVLIGVLLLYMCPLTIYVSSYYICVLLLYMCPLTIGKEQAVGASRVSPPGATNCMLPNPNGVRISGPGNLSFFFSFLQFFFLISGPGNLRVNV